MQISLVYKSLLMILSLLFCVSCTTTPVAVREEPDYRAMEYAQLKEVSEGFARQRLETLSTLIAKSLNAGECDRTKNYAFEAIQLVKNVFTDDRNRGDVLFEGHMALGFCDLRDGHPGSALFHLEAAGAVPSTPLFETTGLTTRDLALARELVVRGQRAPVVRFLEESRRFSNSGVALESIDAWTTAINGGDVPDFNIHTRKVSVRVGSAP